MISGFVGPLGASSVWWTHHSQTLGRPVPVSSPEYPELIALQLAGHDPCIRPLCSGWQPNGDCGAHHGLCALCDSPRTHHKESCAWLAAFNWRHWLGSR